MLKIHKIEFSTDNMGSNEIKEKMSKVIDEVIAEDKKEIKRIDNFIVAIVNLAKIAVDDKKFSADADCFCAELLKQDNSTKRSFFAYYGKSIEDVIDDIICLTADFKSLSGDKEKVNEKTKNNKK